MLLAHLAHVADTVADSSSRTAKRDQLAEALARLEADEIEPAVGFLIGAPRQGAIGVGWATVAAVETEPTTTPELTVCDLDRLLTALGQATGPGSVATRNRLLADLLSRATAPEQHFVRRVITGEVRTGALGGILTDATSRAAEVPLKAMRRAVMLQGDLGQAARIALTGGAEALAAIDLVAGRPIQPMLASTAADVNEAVEALGRVQVDWKLDGARIQVHIEGDEVGVYTRNLNDITDRLPHVAELARSLSCTSAVLDGEVIGLHGDDDLPRAFQDTMSALATDHEPARPSATAWLRPFFFDLMLLDGVSLIDQPLHERTSALDEVIGEHRIPRIVTDDADAAAAHLEAAIAQGHEGVMVKAIDSRYDAGRRGKTWRKVKPVHTLDLVVLAAEWGHGRRQGWLSNLHLGARHPDTGELVMVGKTFKGLTDQLLRWQTERFLELKTGESATGHTVYVEPELVVEIALDGAQTSTRYPGGVALRFARVRAYRPDRSAADADTLEAVRALL